MERQAFIYMAKKPVCINLDLDLKSIAKEFNKTQLSHLLVIDESNKLQGVISRNDLLEEFASLLLLSSGKTYSDLELRSKRASDIMTKDPHVVQKEDSIDLAIEYLLQKSFHCVPVLEEDKPVGILTAFDLLKGYYQEYG